MALYRFAQVVLVVWLIYSSYSYRIFRPAGWEVCLVPTLAVTLLICGHGFSSWACCY